MLLLTLPEDSAAVLCLRRSPEALSFSHHTAPHAIGTALASQALCLLHIAWGTLMRTILRALC